MQHKAHINITLDPQNIRWLDSLRGQEPRSTFLNYILSNLRQKTSIFDWTYESAKAEEDIKKGRVRKFKSTKEATKWLNS